jgi:hypothetical protein
MLTDKIHVAYFFSGCERLKKAMIILITGIRYRG